MTSTVDGRKSSLLVSNKPHALRHLGMLVLAVVALIGGGVAHAATQVSGGIAQNTEWTLAGSPYVLSGAVTITSGAQLLIDAGVVVQLNSNAGLEVMSGSLAAQGTSGNPITFTSINDVNGSATSPAKGDWGQLKFDSGTISASTALTYVNVRYGHGIAIQGASPTLRYVSVDHHSGPAISIDLASSPVGDHISATGNDLNGIAVPAGEIGANITWALTGIPYVVRQGAVAVGQRVFSLAPTFLTLAQGATATIELDIPDPAPQAGLTINTVSSIPSVATVPPNVSMAGGAQTATVTVTAVSLGTSTITASQSGYGTATAKVNVVQAPSALLSPQSGVVGVGKTLPMTVTLSDVAPASGTPVALTAADSTLVSIPNQVNVIPGQTTATFSAQGLALGTTTVTANAQGFGTSTASVRVRPVSLDLPPSIIVAPGSNVSVTVSLSDPAPSGGLTVSLAVTDATLATVPATVAVPAGASAVQFSVAGVSAGVTTLSASAQGYSSASSSVTVQTINIALNPAGTLTIPQGLSQPVQISISKPAPVGGVTIALGIADTTKAVVSPASITIPAGQTATTQTLSVTGAAQGTTQLTAQSPGLVAASDTVQISAPAQLQFYAPYRGTQTGPVVVGKGLTNYYYEAQVQLFSGTSPYSSPNPVVISLTSSDSSKATVTSTVTILAGQNSAYLSISGVDLTPSGTPVTISAAATGFTSPTQPLQVNVVTPQLQFSGLDNNRSTVGGRDNFFVMWQVPGAIGTQTATATQTLTLSIANDNPTGIVPGFHDAATAGNAVTQITIAAGQYDSTSATPNYYLYVDTPTALGTYQVQASLPGVGTWTSAAQTVASPMLQFYDVYRNAQAGPVIVGKGMTSYYYEAQIGVYANGQPIYLASPLTVSLACAATNICSTQPSITIPAGQSSLNIVVQGLDLGATQVVASATGIASPPQSLGITVVTPALNFAGLPGSLNAGQTGSFRVYLTVPNGIGTQNTVGPMSVDLTSASPGVATVSTPVTINANDSYSGYSQITGVASGTTTITASGANLSPVTSSNVTVP